MNFSKISKALVSFAFVNMLSCGIITAQTDDLSSKVVEPNKDSIVKDDSESAPSADSSQKEDELVCEDLGSFTVNFAEYQFMLCKDTETGRYCIKDITDENKNDKDKVGECKSYSMKYSCFICHNPNSKKDEVKADSKLKSESSVAEENKSELKSDESKKETAVVSTADAAVISNK